MKRKFATCFIVVCAVASVCREQQASSTARPEFEVASVKPAATGELNGVYTYPGGRVACRGCNLQYLIQQPFNVQAFQLVGGPMRMPSYDPIAAHRDGLRYPSRPAIELAY